MMAKLTAESKPQDTAAFGALVENHFKPILDGDRAESVAAQVATRAVEAFRARIDGLGQKRADKQRKTQLAKQRNTDSIRVLRDRDGFLTFSKKLISFCTDEPGCASILRRIQSDKRTTP